MPGRDREGELDEEIRSHIDIETLANIDRGMTPDEARYAALRKFGSVALSMELTREAHGFAWLDRLRQDLRYALRMFRRSPAFTAAAVLSLALGAGATALIFSVVNALFLKPLPYPDASRILSVWATNPNLQFGIDEFPLSAGIFVELRNRVRSFENMAAYTPATANLTGAFEPERVSGARVTASLFRVMRVEPALGRAFLEEEDRFGADRVVLLGDGLWRRRFGADRRILGKTVQLGGEPFRVVGVMPPGFRFPAGAELPAMFHSPAGAEYWLPAAFSPDDIREVGNLSHAMIARLKPGVSIQQARAELNAVTAAIIRGIPDAGSGWGATAEELPRKVVASVRPAVLVLFGAVAFVLAIACVNVANLLLARAARRREELAVRLALGASRGRIIRQLLSESYVLCAAGSAGGVALAAAGIRVLRVLAPTGFPRLDEVTLDWRVLLFSLAVYLLTGTIFGLAPAFELKSASLDRQLRAGGGRSALHAGRGFRKALVIGEFAACVVLVTGAVLLARSFARLTSQKTGFDAQHVLTAEIPLPGIWRNDRRRDMVREVLRNCVTLPGIEAAAITDNLPLTRENQIATTEPDGFPPTRRAELPGAEYRSVTPDYFRALAIPLVRGRLFTAADNQKAPSVAVINETTARTFWPGARDSLGKRLRRDETGDWITVVGVVGDVRSSALDKNPLPQIYRPFEQEVLPDLGLVVRSRLDPRFLAASIRRAVWRVDKDQPVSRVRVLQDIVNESVSGRRFQTMLLVAFAFLALTLAAVGIYGVISYSAAQRTHEIGIRMALGARPADALRMILREGMALASCGAVAGTAAAFALSPALRTSLYGIAPADPVAFATGAAILLGVAAAACSIPARRAAKVNPITALRYE